MSNINHEENGVNEYGINDEVVSPGRCPADQQRRPGRNPTTAGTRRKKWTQVENEVAMECYLRSEPEKRGYRKRVVELWRQKDMAEISEQRLMDQIRQTKKKGWLSQLEIERIKRRIVEKEVGGESAANDVIVEVNVCTDGNIPELNQQFDNDNPAVNAESAHQVDEGTIRAEQFEDELFTESEKATVERLKIIMNEKKRKPLPSLKKINKEQILKEVKEVNEVLEKVRTDTITTTNDLMYAAAVIVSENLGLTREPIKVRKEPWWKRRLTNQIEQMRKDLSRIERLKSGHPIKNRYKDDLQRKYWLKEKGLNHVKEEIKQRVKAKAAKIKRYDERIKQFRENQLFRTDQSRFYKELNGDNGRGERPEKEEAKNFWSSIMSQLNG